MVISSLPVRVLGQSGNFREGRVAKSCLTEKFGLHVYRKYGAGTLSWICTEQPLSRPDNTEPELIQRASMAPLH